MPRPPRRDREILRIREDILEAAARAFAEKGFHAATMQDIAREAGYTAASLYTYFESKEKIFEGIRDVVIREFAASFEEPVPEGLNLRQRLELLLYRQYQILDRHRDAFAVLLAGAREGRPVACQDPDHRPPHGFFLFVDGLRKFLADAGWAAEYPETPVDDAALILAGLHNAFFIRWVATGSPDRLADRAADVVGYFFHGVAGEARREPRRTRG